MKKILIVEDELIIAEDIRIILEGLNYKVVDTVIKAEQAIKILNEQTVDLVLIDIILKGKLSGIDLANIINKNYQIPFIFLTSNSDKKTVEKAIETQPKGYVVKPFNQSDLFTSISLALNTTKENTSPLNFSNNQKDYYFFKIDGVHKKIIFSEINYLRSAGNYVEVYTKNNKYLVRSTFKQIAGNLPELIFLQIHRSFIININNITSYTSTFVKFNTTILNVSKKYLDSFNNALKRI